MPKSMTTLFNNFAIKPKTLIQIKGWGNLQPGHVLTYDNKLLYPKIQPNRFEKKETTTSSTGWKFKRKFK
jgi:hypothetical protein